MMRRVLLTTWLFLTLFIVGCGGGTTGSDGGQTVRILGALIDQRSAPITAATITILDSGESTQTDDSGAFALETPSSQTLTFEVVTGALRLQSTVGGLDPARTELPLTIQIDTERGTIIVENVSITPNPEPTATPRNSPSTPTPSPTPTSGTESPSIILGTIINQQDAPVAGVTARLLGSSASAVSDSSGAFRLEAVVRGSTVRLRITSGSNSGTVTIGGLPSEPFTLTLTLRFGPNPNTHSREFTVTVEARTVRQRE